MQIESNAVGLLLHLLTGKATGTALLGEANSGAFIQELFYLCPESEAFARLLKFARHQLTKRESGRWSKRLSQKTTKAFPDFECEPVLLLVDLLAHRRGAEEFFNKCFCGNHLCTLFHDESSEERIVDGLLREAGNVDAQCEREQQAGTANEASDAATNALW